jgi:hypothetical protein
VDFITIIVESNFQYRQGANHQERKCRVLKPLSSSSLPGQLGIHQKIGEENDYQTRVPKS